MAASEPKRLAAAAGLSYFVLITAGAMGTSISTTLWDDRAALHHAHLTEPLTSGQGVFANTLASLQAAGLSAEQAMAQVNRMIDQQAYTRAADDIFYGSAVLFLCLIALIGFTRRPPKLAGAGADAGGAH